MYMMKNILGEIEMVIVCFVERELFCFDLIWCGCNERCDYKG